MTVEDVREHADQALELAIAGNVDMDEVEAIFEERLDRIEAIRTVRGDA